MVQMNLIDAEKKGEERTREGRRAARNEANGHRVGA
jgi:hypothetical protein